jgi:hypothetical protein
MTVHKAAVPASCHRAEGVSSTHPPDGALSRTSLRPRPRSQRSSASIASSYHDQCAQARNIFILRFRTSMSYSCRRATSGSIRDARLAGA